ncbi:MAG: chemotaxis protein CheW [Proteobacteria bacterium]|nr:chemotaxis protein CheW [Pseudomonadota bacterium]
MTKDIVTNNTSPLTNVGSEVVLQLVVFSLMGEEFGVSIHEVREIISHTQVTPVPQAPAFVEGVINLRGQIIPVVDLRKRFNLESSDKKENSNVVIIEVGAEVLGLVVDSVSEVLNIPSGSINPPPALVANGIGAEYIKGIGQYNDKMIILIDLGRVFSDDELKDMKAPSAESLN